MTLGIIGGMGPLATAMMFERIIDMTDAPKDQDHMEILIMNCPWIADRTAYIMGESEENPCPQIIGVGRRLKEAGADILAMPCVTSHYFADEIAEKTGLPLVNMPRETARYLKTRGIRRAGIMATDGTLKGGVFRKALMAEGIGLIEPDEARQRDVMDIIYRQVKAGPPPGMEQFYRVKEYLLSQGAEAVILGCTEYEVVKARNNVGRGCISALDVLCASCVQRCGYPLKALYWDLMT